MTPRYLIPRSSGFFCRLSTFWQFRVVLLRVRVTCCLSGVPSSAKSRNYSLCGIGIPRRRSADPGQWPRRGPSWTGIHHHRVYTLYSRPSVISARLPTCARYMPMLSIGSFWKFLFSGMFRGWVITRIDLEEEAVTEIFLSVYLKKKLHKSWTKERR